ncbi:unnamed protein product [Notodromas monacha]|uniref:Uncharacterized protein n=1 Tax=Notodromas monacha TaxID=399045 RepID=A0A7R9GDJ9_9CRUS|nr:unnamed protein product [Notodromas monacha]CAG0918624.1 unnamed protein product [Notodromas monacha]
MMFVVSTIQSHVFTLVPSKSHYSTFHDREIFAMGLYDNFGVKTFSNFGPSTSTMWWLLGGVPKTFQAGMNNSTAYMPYKLLKAAYGFTPRVYVMDPLKSWYGYRRSRLQNNVLSVSLKNVLAYGTAWVLPCAEFLDSFNSSVATIVGGFVMTASDEV